MSLLASKERIAMKSKFILYLKIYLTFFKVSSLTFGGGYAILPLLKSEVVERRKWIDEDELIDVFTASQIVPGLLYVSSATFIGYRVAGIIGAVIATAAVLVPSALAIMALIILLGGTLNYPVIQKALVGIIIGVAAMMAKLSMDMMKKSVRGFWSILLLVVSFILIEFLNVKPFEIILAGICSGLAYSYFLKDKKDGKQNA